MAERRSWDIDWKPERLSARLLVFGEELLDGIEIRRVFRLQEQSRASGANGASAFHGGSTDSAVPLPPSGLRIQTIYIIDLKYLARRSSICSISLRNMG